MSVLKEKQLFIALSFDTVTLSQLLAHSVVEVEYHESDISNFSEQLKKIKFR